jgi:phosphatidylserine/phosphatidylglycerophosphate/cardiolipin synthase-like enzyme
MKKILQPGRNCQGVYDVHRSGLLIDGRIYYRSFYDAAARAKRFILMTGWQFERSVRLLRGKDEEEARGDVRMAPFLNSLCERNPHLEIFILMWDFSAVVALDKEWFNKLVLDLTASDRIHFRFDSNHAIGGSHHQKLVVIDGVIAFVGGLDFCANGWDDRKHWSENADRVLAGENYEPYHDIQSIHSGPVAWELTKLFERRWVHAGGLELSLSPPPDFDDWPVGKTLPLAAKKVAISVTRAQTLVPMLEPLMHIRQLFLDAIASAEHLIYMESQYFTSQAVFQALNQRMTDLTRPRLEIVLILPKRPHTLVEDISLSVIQAKILRSLTKTASRNGQNFGVYYSAAALKEGWQDRATYIHSKVLLVDDRFLSVGSANLTNRSMGMDTELNVSWEADSTDGQELRRSIRRVRGNLLAEHTGLRKLSHRRALGGVDGIVHYLNDQADREGCRLRRHTMESFLEDKSWIKDLMPEDLAIDPERPLIEESIYERISRDPNGIFAKGILLLNQLALAEPPERIEDSPIRKWGISEPGSRGSMGDKGMLNWLIIAAISLAVAVAAWLLFDP